MIDPGDSPPAEGAVPFDEVMAQLQGALVSGVPEMYVNGFSNGLSQGDVFSVLVRNGRPVAVLNMSYTVAKTYSVMLAELVAQFEERMDRTMLTTMDIAAGFASKKDGDGTE